jgi:hypothetical protein
LGILLPSEICLLGSNHDRFGHDIESPRKNPVGNFFAVYKERVRGYLFYLFPNYISLCTPNQNDELKSQGKTKRYFFHLIKRKVVFSVKIITDEGDL